MMARVPVFCQNQGRIQDTLQGAYHQFYLAAGSYIAGCQAAFIFLHCLLREKGGFPSALFGFNVFQSSYGPSNAGGQFVVE